VAYAVEVGVDEGGAGMILSVGSLTGIAARLVFGWLIDRRQNWGPAVMAALLAGGCVGYLLVGSGDRAPLLLGALLAFGAGWGWSGLLTFSVVHAYPHAPAAATGISQGGMFVGAALGPPLFGLLADRGSFHAAWYAAAAATGCAALLAAYVAFAGFGWSIGPTTNLPEG
jgi:cyanate permease